MSLDNLSKVWISVELQEIVIRQILFLVYTKNIEIEANGLLNIKILLIRNKMFLLEMLKTTLKLIPLQRSLNRKCKHILNI